MFSETRFLAAEGGFLAFLGLLESNEACMFAEIVTQR